MIEGHDGLDDDDDHGEYDGRDDDDLGGGCARNHRKMVRCE